VKTILDAVINDGYSGSVFAYGQTGAGKTYTMTGIEPNSKADIEQHKSLRIIISDLF
jgi:hypothetical protein